MKINMYLLELLHKFSNFKSPKSADFRDSVQDINNFYPEWVCAECGNKASNGRHFNYSTWHEGECEICGEKKTVTQPRDFFYPDFSILTKNNGKY